MSFNSATFSNNFNNGFVNGSRFGVELCFVIICMRIDLPSIPNYTYADAVVQRYLIIILMQYFAVFWCFFIGFICTSFIESQQ